MDPIHQVVSKQRKAGVLFSVSIVNISIYSKLFLLYIPIFILFFLPFKLSVFTLWIKIFFSNCIPIKGTIIVERIWWNKDIKFCLRFQAFCYALDFSPSERTEIDDCLPLMILIDAYFWMNVVNHFTHLFTLSAITIMVYDFRILFINSIVPFIREFIYQ